MAVSASRLNSLDHGVNLPHWFWGGFTDPDPVRVMQTYITSQDITLLKNAGVDHVRLPVDVSYLINWNDPGQLNTATLQLLGQAISMIQSQGLAVIVTPFGDFEQKVVQPEYLDEAKTFWSAFAGYLKQFNPDKLFMEVANEPVTNPANWHSIEEQLFAVMRTAAPNHTFIGSTSLKFGDGANDWGSVQSLTQSTPSADGNVVYNLHFYEPFYFTHQGSQWSDAVTAMIKGLPYYSTPQNVEPLAHQLELQITDPNLAWVPQWVRDYGASRMDAVKLEAMIAPAAAWARAHNVPLQFDEFGVFKDGGVNLADRANYLLDLRVIMAEQGIRWTTWDYAAGFGLVTKDVNGVATLDATTASALGLNYLLTGVPATLAGGSAVDSLTGSSSVDELCGNAGNDVLRGNAANDVMFGGAGADNYLFRTGDGKDVVSEYDGDASAAVVDKIVLENVSSISAVQFSKLGSHLLINYGSGDEIRVFDQFDTAHSFRWVEELELSGGQRFTLSHDPNATVFATAIAPPPPPPPSNLILTGTSRNDVLTGQIGNDTLSGLGGKDTLNGGAGHDRLDGGDGNDQLLGLAGNDSLIGGDGNDSLNGGDGNDTLVGGAGNDDVSGGTGSDLFQFLAGRDNGKDVVLDFVHGQDLLQFSGVSSFAQIVGMMTDKGSDILISGSGWNVLVEHVDQLGASDFTWS